ncbi:MAG: glycosyltransferase [Deltaproteobacteria bacterium]|nr:glycosyltransferase [Deltaproteobacteria bacterium]
MAGEFWKAKDNYMWLIKNLGISDSVRVVDAYIPNEEIGLYFSAADLVVQPYRSASGSGICQLAYGFGKPVIATNVGSLGEVVIDGVNGRIVPPENAKALADAISSSLKPETLTKLTANSRLTAEKFSWYRLMHFIFSGKEDPVSVA